MGFLLRSAVVIGTIFAISPVHDRHQGEDRPTPDRPAPSLKGLAEAGATRAREAAEAACGPGATRCILGVLGALHEQDRAAADRRTPERQGEPVRRQGN